MDESYSSRYFHRMYPLGQREYDLFCIKGLNHKQRQETFASLPVPEDVVAFDLLFYKSGAMGSEGRLAWVDNQLVCTGVYMDGDRVYHEKNLPWWVDGRRVREWGFAMPFSADDTLQNSSTVFRAFQNDDASFFANGYRVRAFVGYVPEVGLGRRILPTASELLAGVGRVSQRKVLRAGIKVRLLRNTLDVVMDKSLRTTSMGGSIEQIMDKLVKEGCRNVSVTQ